MALRGHTNKNDRAAAVKTMTTNNHPGSQVTRLRTVVYDFVGTAYGCYCETNTTIYLTNQDHESPD